MIWFHVMILISLSFAYLTLAILVHEVRKLCKTLGEVERDLRGMNERLRRLEWWMGQKG